MCCSNRLYKTRVDDRLSFGTTHSLFSPPTFFSRSFPSLFEFPLSHPFHDKTSDWRQKVSTSISRHLKTPRNMLVEAVGLAQVTHRKSTHVVEEALLFSLLPGSLSLFLVKLVTCELLSLHSPLSLPAIHYPIVVRMQAS